MESRTRGDRPAPRESQPAPTTPTRPTSGWEMEPERGVWVRSPGRAKTEPREDVATISPGRVRPGRMAEPRPMPPLEELRIAHKFNDLITDRRTWINETLRNPPTLQSHATQHDDGREQRVVLLQVLRKDDGATRPGIRVRLLKGNRLLDQATTSPEGMALLTFPGHGATPGLGSEALGKVQILGDADGLPKTVDVNIPAGQQHIVLEVPLTELPLDVPIDVNVPGNGTTSPTTGNGGATHTNGHGTTTPTLTNAGGVAPKIPDDPFDRLPPDFTVELCQDLVKFLGTRRDSLLFNPNNLADFRNRRTRLLKRLTVPRIGDTVDDKSPPRRYLVQLRQEWIFLGNTLGELKAVEALDPGQVVEQAIQQAQRTTQTTEEATSRALRTLLVEIQNTLNQVNNVDSVIKVSTRAKNSVQTSGFGEIGPRVKLGGGLAGAIIGGIAGGPLGAVAGGLIGGALSGGDFSGKAGIGGEVGTRTATSTLALATTKTNVHTSLHVNSLLRNATSEVNNVVNTLTATMRSIESTLSRTVGQVSPLLAQVSNILRWTVYENYVVCTQVESVVEIREQRVTTPDEVAAAKPNPSRRLERAIEEAQQRLMDMKIPNIMGMGGSLGSMGSFGSVLSDVLSDVMGASQDAEDLFSVEDIVEYRRIFGPVLLEPLLQQHFEVLREAIERRKRAQLPVARVHCWIDYSAQQRSADLRFKVRDAEAYVRLTPGSTRAYVQLQFPTPVPPTEMGEASLDLTLRSDGAPTMTVPNFPTFPWMSGGAGGALPNWLEAIAGMSKIGRCEIHRVRFGFESTPGAPLEQTHYFPSGLLAVHPDQTGKAEEFF